MAISFTIYAHNHYFISSWSGDISDSDLVPSYKQLFKNKEYKPGFHEIADIRNAHFIGVTAKGMNHLSLFIQSHLPKCEPFKTAAVVPDSLSFELTRIYQEHSEESPESVQVFKDMNEALNWIGHDIFK